MATFPDISPSYGLQKISKPDVRVIKFGDGFEQRLTFGIQQNPKTYNLTWNNLTEENVDIIESFLDSRAFDNESFDFTPPKEAISKSGTFSRASGSKNAVITAANHGIALGVKVVLDFASGINDGTYIVNARTQNTFTIETDATSAVSGDVSCTISGQGKYKCETWNKTINYPTRSTINATFIQVFEV
jgi:phage-related protein